MFFIPDGPPPSERTRLDPDAAEILAQIERLEYVYEVMSKEWQKIQESWREPWRLSK